MSARDPLAAMGLGKDFDLDNEAAAAPGHGPISAGRFVYEVYVEADDVWTYSTSWDTWEDAEVAFPIEDGRLLDTATGRVWRPGSPYEWEAAQT